MRVVLQEEICLCWLSVRKFSYRVRIYVRVKHEGTKSALSKNVLGDMSTVSLAYMTLLVVPVVVGVVQTHVYEGMTEYSSADS